MKQKFERLFKPRSIAVVGASDVQGKVGHMIAQNLIAHSYQGAVYFVNPARNTILDQTCYPTLADLPKKVDCAIIAVPAHLVYDIIHHGKERCKNFVVISAGFGETGIAGHNQEMQLATFAQEHDITILGPNCLGFLVPPLGVNASFAPGLPHEGNIALISQSGALAVAAMDKAQEEHIGFSAVVSTGNEMLVTAADLVRYFADDTATKTIILYMEGVVRGEDFLHAVRYAREKDKTVAVLKAGRTDDAQKAIALHTGSLAGSDEIFGSALKKAGGIRLQTIEELFATMVYVSHYEIFKKDEIHIGIVTNAGGPGVLTTDAIAELCGLRMSVLSAKTKKDLLHTLPQAASVHNPVDVLGDAGVERYSAGMQAVISDKNTDIVIALLTPQAQTPVMDIARGIVAFCKENKKQVIASFVGGERVAGAVAYLRDNGVVHYASLQCILDVLARFTEKQTHYRYPVTRSGARERKKEMTKVLSGAKDRGALYFEECATVAQIYGISVSRFFDITKGLSAQQRIAYPCVAKIDDPHVLHKTDRGGVILPIRNLAELHRAQSHLLHLFASRSARVIVQPLLPIKMELIIGMKRDPKFGVVVIVGLGGIYAEVFRVTEFFIAPLSIAEIRDILLHGSLGFLFAKTRGMHAYHLEVVAHSVLQVSLIGVENAVVQAIDINPFLVYNDDREDVAVDFKIIIKN
ncbi:MAG: acetate--CoA ligase family protein [Parcubacteria group bacterium]|jgi:acetyltransferase